MKPALLTIIACITASRAVCAFAVRPPRLPNLTWLRKTWGWVNVPRLDTDAAGWIIGAVVGACLVCGWWQSN